MKKVIITGATGFIGRHCLHFLLEKGYEVYAIYHQRPSAKDLQIHWIPCDLFREHDLAQLFSNVRPTHLLHLAWDVRPGKFWNASENILWVQSSLNLLRYFVENGGSRIVGAGTCAEYDWTQGICSEDHSPCIPASLYGTCKYALFKILESYCTQMQMSFAWGRIFYVYGPKEYPERFIPALILSLLKKQTFACSHGRQVRDFLHVEDVASAFVALLDSQVQGAVNIGSGTPISLREIAGRISKILQGSERIQFGAKEAPLNDPEVLLPSLERLNSEVKWTPKYDLETGLHQTISWWKEHEINY